MKPIGWEKCRPFFPQAREIRRQKLRVLVILRPPLGCGGGGRGDAGGGEDDTTAFVSLTVLHGPSRYVTRAFAPFNRAAAVVGAT